MVKTARFCIELVKTVAIGRHPDRTLAIVGDRVDIVAAEAIAVGVAMFILVQDRSVFADHRDTVTPSPGPQVTRRIFAKTKNIIAPDAFTAGRTIHKMGEEPHALVELVETAAIGADP